MSQNYLLPCPECGTDQQVTTRNAGGSISCKNCDANIDVPKLGDLRNLDIAETGTKSAQSLAWDARKGRTFAVGMIIFVVCIATSIGLLLYSRSIDTTDEFAKRVDVMHEAIDKMSPTDLYIFWTKDIEVLPPREWEKSEWLKKVELKNQLFWWGWITMVLSLGGVALIVWSIAMKPLGEVRRM